MLSLSATKLLSLRLKSTYANVVVCLTDGRKHSQSWSFYSCSEQKRTRALEVTVVRFESWSKAIPYLRTVLSGVQERQHLEDILEGPEDGDGAHDIDHSSRDDEDSHEEQDEEGSEKNNSSSRSPGNTPPTSQSALKLPQELADQAGVFSEQQLRATYLYRELAKTSPLVRELMSLA